MFFYNLNVSTIHLQNLFFLIYEKFRSHKQLKSTFNELIFDLIFFVSENFENYCNQIIFSLKTRYFLNNVFII